MSDQHCFEMKGGSIGYGRIAVLRSHDGLVNLAAMGKGDFYEWYKLEEAEAEKLGTTLIRMSYPQPVVPIYNLRGQIRLFMGRFLMWIGLKVVPDDYAARYLWSARTTPAPEKTRKTLTQLLTLEG